MDFDMGDHSALGWFFAEAEQILVDAPLVSSNDTSMPALNVPDVFINTFDAKEPSKNCTFHSALIATRHVDDGHRVEQMQMFDDGGYDLGCFLNLDDYYMPTHQADVPVPATPNLGGLHGQFAMVEASDLLLHGAGGSAYKPPAAADTAVVVTDGGGVPNHCSRCSGAAGTGRAAKPSSIGFEEISKYFYMTITDAAKEMKVGLTVLKKRCRELGISRWPHRKMKSLKSLIHNVQELGKGSGDVNIQKEIESLQENSKLIEKMPELELSEKTKKLRQACFKANYKKRRAMQTPPQLGTYNKALRL